MRSNRPIRIISELGIIVLGVLIALAADSWHEGRENRERLLDHLTALQVDLELTSQDLEGAMDVDSLQLSNVLEVLNQLRVGSEDGPAGQKGRLHWSGFEARMGAVNTLVHTGDMSLLDAGPLQQEIERYASVVSAVSRWLADADRGMWDNIRDVTAVAERLAYQQAIVPSVSEARYGPELLYKLDLGILREHPEIAGAYSFHALGLQNRLWAVGELRGPLASLQERLEDELERLSR